MTITTIGTQFIRIPNLPKVAFEEGLELAAKILTPNFQEQFATQPIKLTILIPENMPTIESSFYIGLLEELLEYTRDKSFPDNIPQPQPPASTQENPQSTCDTTNIIDPQSILQDIFNATNCAPLENFIKDKIILGFNHKDGTNTIPNKNYSNPALDLEISKYKQSIFTMLTCNFSLRNNMPKPVKITTDPKIDALNQRIQALKCKGKFTIIPTPNK